MQNMTSQDINDILLEDSAPTGGKKNKKKRGKQVQNQNSLGEQDPDKLAEEFNNEVNKEIEKLKDDWAKQKEELKAKKADIELKCKETQDQIKSKKDA